MWNMPQQDNGPEGLELDIYCLELDQNIIPCYQTPVDNLLQDLEMDVHFPLS